MVNALQDPASSTSVAEPAAPHRGSTALRVGLAVLVVLLAVVGADRARDLLPNWGNPVEEQVIDRRQPALLLALSDLSEYHASKGAFEVVVDLERDTPYVPSMIKGERTTYLAHGTVDGVVDLRALGASAVETEGDSVTFTLPRPRLGAVVLDLEKSRVVARDRGLVDRFTGAFDDSPTSERDVAVLAQDKIRSAAVDSDLLRRAQENTRQMLAGLSHSFGYTDVTVRFDADAAG